MYAAYLKTSDGQRLCLGRFRTRAAAAAAVERCKATRRSVQAKSDAAAAKAKKAVVRVARKAQRDSLRQAKLDAAAAEKAAARQAKLDAAAARQAKRDAAAAEKAAARQAKLDAQLAAKAAARQAKRDAAAEKAAARERREVKPKRTAEQVAEAHQHKLRQQADWRMTKLRSDPDWAERHRARKRRSHNHQMESPMRREQYNRTARENYARRKASRSLPVCTGFG